MRVKVEACGGGGDSYSWRLTLPNGKRSRLRMGEHERWTRATSQRALDLLEADQGIERSKVRFVFH